MTEIYDITYDEIEAIKDLWEKNRQYHEDSSQHFGNLYRFANFEQRIGAFRELDEDDMKITLAKNDDKVVGYCLSNVSNGKGEVESLHVAESCRGRGIGKLLVTGHIEWMKGKGCKTIGVTVSQENEAAIGFYKELGFFPNTLYMQQK